jgi:hypothetical protein
VKQRLRRPLEPLGRLLADLSGPRRVLPLAAVTGASGRRLSLLLAAMILSLLGGTVARAEPQYINRNNNEFYVPYLLLDNFPLVSPALGRLFQDEYARRFLMLTYGESRVNRAYFVDVAFEGLLPIDMPGYPSQILGRAQEVQVLDPKDATVRAEVYGAGHLSKTWELGVDVATRAHLVLTEIPAEFYARVVATHHGFAGLNPLNTGFLVGPEIRPLDVAIGGFTVGAFGQLSQSRNTYSLATARMTWWGSADPFQNLMRFQLTQVATFANRRLVARASAEADLRQVRQERYKKDFGQDPERDRYIDLALEASLLAELPAKFRFDVSGRFVPFHTPDPFIVRWYRPVYPELSAVLERKVAIFDLAAGYSFSWVPPLYQPGHAYDDPGRGIIPGSAPGHLFTLTINLKI